MNKMRIMILRLLLIICLISSCATSNTSNYSTFVDNTVKNYDFGLIVFSYPLYPDKHYIVLKEHNDIEIASRILSSYNTNDLINALSIAYTQLSYEQQQYVSNAFKNTTTLPYRFQESVVIAVTSGDEIHQNPTLNALKNLIIVSYGNMGQDEIQSRYYYGLNSVEQNVFKERWKTVQFWYKEKQRADQEQYQSQVQSNQAQVQSNQAQVQSNRSQVQSNQSGGFWNTLGTIIVGVVAGYLAYRASTYNSRINHQLNSLKFEHSWQSMQLRNIQHDLRRLAY